MRYLLVVGFFCDVYREEPKARIFVNNQLIDEFFIKHHKDSFLTDFENFFGHDKRYKLRPYNKIEFKNIFFKNIPFLRFYEIEIDNKQDRLSLHINITNNDNNYSNGFMTASTLLQLRIFYFLPLNKNFLTRLGKIFKKNIISKNYAWFHCSKNNIFNLTSNCKWIGKNQKIIKTNSRNAFMFRKIGGSGHFECELIKKYNMLIPKLIKSYRYNLDLSSINYLLDKYQQHANQRNTD